MLTGKAKEDFLEWLVFLPIGPYTSMFDSIPLIVQQAYITEWLDTVGLKTIIYPTMYVDYYDCDIFGWNDCYQKDFSTRQEAITAAIKTSDEIYNNNKL